MDVYDRTQQLLKNTDIPATRIAADTNLSMSTIYKLRRGVPYPKYASVKAVYEYLSGRRLEV